MQPARSSKLAVFKPPIRVEGFTLHAAWYARRDDDPAVRHAADAIADVLAR